VRMVRVGVVEVSEIGSVDGGTGEKGRGKGR
jgi:hypothetical protein